MKGILVDAGSGRYQDVIDRFINGEPVADLLTLHFLGAHAYAKK